MKTQGLISWLIFRLISGPSRMLINSSTYSLWNNGTLRIRRKRWTRNWSFLEGHMRVQLNSQGHPNPPAFAFVWPFGSHRAAPGRRCSWSANGTWLAKIKTSYFSKDLLFKLLSHLAQAGTSTGHCFTDCAFSPDRDKTQHLNIIVTASVTEYQDQVCAPTFIVSS